MVASATNFVSRKQALLKHSDNRQDITVFVNCPHGTVGERELVAASAEKDDSSKSSALDAPRIARVVFLATQPRR